MTTESAEETMRLGWQLGERLSPGQVVALSGPLGAGKTTFIRGLAVGLGLQDPREVKSPTFVLVKEYHARLPIAHVDLYRLEQQHEAVGLDLSAYFNGETVCLIEWADKFPELLPSEYVQVTCEHLAPTARRVTVTGCGAAAARVIAALHQRASAAPCERRA